MAKVSKFQDLNFLFTQFYRSTRRFASLFLLATACIYLLTAAVRPDAEKRFRFDVMQSNAWVDSIFNTMDADQRIGQLFMVAAYSNRTEEHTDEIASLIKNCHIGGLIFFQGGPVRQAMLTNYYQSLASVPLLVSIDGEWGLAMRLDSTMQFPHQMTLGAIQDNRLIYSFGQEMAKECRRIGIHINLAPVVDVNNNPANPVINDRSFGEDKYNVAAKSIAYMQGMQDGGIMANAKHFPGHGNTDKDSHKTLPTVRRTRQQIDSIELYPFRELMNRGLASVMVAHLAVPALDTTPNQASTLSKQIVTDLLKNNLRYTGLVFTDALNMKGVSSYYPPGIVDVKALLAGNDVLLFSEDVQTAINEIKHAVETGQISMDEINIRVKKILMAKYLSGLHRIRPINIVNLYEDLNSDRAKILNTRLYEASITLLKNKNKLIPLRIKPGSKAAVLTVGNSPNNEFARLATMYEPMEKFYLDKSASPEQIAYASKALEGYSTVLVGLHNMSGKDSRNYGISPGVKEFLNQLQTRSKVILTVFGNPYSLRNFDNFEPIVVAYEDNDYTRKAAAQVIFGALWCNGKLPVTASSNFKCGDGFSSTASDRFRFGMPEEVKMDSKKLSQIDNIVKKAIAAGAMPGCQVLVAKDGKIVYEKAFGQHSNTDTSKVTLFDLYDVASVTKVAATTLAAMRLYEEGKLDLDKKLVDYLADAKISNKKNLVIKDILSHQAGLKSWIPFWKTSLDTNEKGYLVNYRSTPDVNYSTQVADSLFIKKGYDQKIWDDIYLSKVENQGQYLYSDLGFYFMKAIVERQAQMKLDEYVNKQFYQPLGLSRITYLPLKKFPRDRIVPTEDDSAFRQRLIWGYVHDPGAAMLGGVAGHAGLFATAEDLAVIMQLLLNNGTYGGTRYFKPETVTKFTTSISESNRRGLGFDKPETTAGKASPTCKSASPLTFGHTGFTGTCVWADPKYNLVYIFLSNRVNPSAENKKLVDMNVRTEIQQVIYDALK